MKLILEDNKGCREKKNEALRLYRISQRRGRVYHFNVVVRNDHI